jgi:hypothetical protein
MVEQTLVSPVALEGKIISLAEMYIQNQVGANGIMLNIKSIQF